MSVETIVVLVIVAANLIWLRLRSCGNARAKASAKMPQGAAEREQAEARSPEKKGR